MLWPEKRFSLCALANRKDRGCDEPGFGRRARVRSQNDDHDKDSSSPLPVTRSHVLSHILTTGLLKPSHSSCRPLYVYGKKVLSFMNLPLHCAIHTIKTKHDLPTCPTTIAYSYLALSPCTRGHTPATLALALSLAPRHRHIPTIMPVFLCTICDIFRQVNLLSAPTGYGVSIRMRRSKHATRGPGLAARGLFQRLSM